MPPRKGVMPKNFETHIRGKKQFSKENRQHAVDAAEKACLARWTKRDDMLALQKCMKALLTTNVNDETKAKVLERYGFKGEQQSNTALVVLALFKKAMTGDVSAIKQITEMQNQADEYLQTTKGRVATQSINVNLVSHGETFKISKEDKEDIMKAESGIPIDLEDDSNDSWEIDSDDEFDDWEEDDIYTG